MPRVMKNHKYKYIKFSSALSSEEWIPCSRIENIQKSLKQDMFVKQYSVVENNKLNTFK